MRGTFGGVSGIARAKAARPNTQRPLRGLPLAGPVTRLGGSAGINQGIKAYRDKEQCET